MKLDKSLEPFRAAIEALHRLLHKFYDRGVIIGGIAVGFLGKPRFTADIDPVFLLSTMEIAQFIELAQAEAIFPRIQNAEDFARKNRVLLLKHKPTEMDIDISLGILPFEQEMVERALRSVGFRGVGETCPAGNDHYYFRTSNSHRALSFSLGRGAKISEGFLRICYI